MSSKANLYSVTQLRTIADENLSEVFGSLGYEESFTFTDFKLGLGLITVALSGGLFLIEKKISFNDSYYPTIGILVLYFITSGILWVFTQSSKYKDIKFIGTNDANEKITCLTSTTKYDPIYNIELQFGEERKKTSIEFMKMFDDFSNFHPDNLTEVLKKEIEKVAKKDQ